MKEKKIIGFYNFSVVLTYIGLAFSVFGMTVVLRGKVETALACLMMSGLCDMFDGKIARAMTRTDDEKRFGVQIDSLCDLVCFGVFPAIIVYSFSPDSVLGSACMTVYVLAAVIRLGFFNVMEEKRQSQTTENRKEYQGLPVTSIAILMPFICLFRDKTNFIMILQLCIILIAVLFISNIKVRKPGKSGAIVMLTCATIIFLKVFGIF